MHNNFPNIYYFINGFNGEHIKSLPKNIALIYRNYEEKANISLIKKIRDFCKIYNRKFYLAENFKLAISLNLDGVYIPAFNNSFNVKFYNLKKKFIILGSAHNIREINIKLLQKIDILFISPLFDSKLKKGINILEFRKLASYCNCKIVALGGINKKNFKKVITSEYKWICGNNFFFYKKKRPIN